MRWFRSYGIIQNVMKKYYAKSCDILHKVDGPRPLSLVQVSRLHIHHTSLLLIFIYGTLARNRHVVLILENMMIKL